MGALFFSVLRDWSGTVQIVWEESNADQETELNQAFANVPLESVVQVI
jgi:aspartyl-tRNA synthetase